MVVVTQDKVQVIPFDSFVFTVCKCGSFVATHDVVEKPSEILNRVIARYKDEDEAKKVLEEMYTAYSQLKFVYVMPEGESEV